MQDLTANLRPRLSPAAAECQYVLETIREETADVRTFLGNDDEAAANDDAASQPFEPIAESRVMRQLLKRAERYAQSSATVLMTGESGSGKEVISRFVHGRSRRSQQPYVRVNCAALSENLIDSEFFGHERGAFTGATEQRIGRFEAAAGGTILLDEISEIPLRLQAKLLRILEEDEFQRVGSNETLPMLARIIASSNRDLRREVAAGTFREDLYYRLNILQLTVPPLRERREDIEALVAHFIHTYRGEAIIPITEISEKAMERLVSFRWPGNVRQLRNAIHRTCVLSEHGKIEIMDLDELLDSELPDAPNVAGTGRMQLDQLERHAILSALDRHKGNKTLAANELGVTSRTLSNKLKRYRQEDLGSATKTDEESVAL